MFLFHLIVRMYYAFMRNNACHNFSIILKPLLVFIFTTVIANSVFAQTSWKGTASTLWQTSSNWTNGIPNASTDAIIGDANFTGVFQPQITKSATCKNLILGNESKASSLDISKALLIKGNLTIGLNGTMTHHSNNNISIAGNWSNNGAYNTNPSGSRHPIVTFTGTAQSIAGVTTFSVLTINAGSITTSNNNINILKTFTVNGTFDPTDAANLVTFTGASFIVNATGIIKVKQTLFSSNYSMNPALNGTSIVDYASTIIPQTIASFNHGAIQISGNTVKTLSGNITTSSSSTTSGNVNVSAGTLDLSTFTLNRNGIGGGSFTIAQNATLKIGGINSFPLSFTSYNLGTISNVEYYGNNQTVSSKSYGNLILSGTLGNVIKTMPSSSLTIANNFTSSIGGATTMSFSALANISIIGTATIGASKTFGGGAFSHTIAGNFINNGTFTGSSSTLNITGTAKNISGTGSFNIFNLNVSGNGTTILATNVTIVGNLSTTSPGTLIHATGGTISMSGASKIISGTNISFENLLILGSVSTATSFMLTGNLQVDGSFSATVGSIINFTGTSKAISGSGTISFYAIKFPGTYSTTNSFSISSDMSGLGKFTATGGLVTFVGISSYAGAHDFFNLRLNGTKLQLGTTSILSIANTLDLTAGLFDVTSSIPNTVNYNGSGVQNVIATTYNNLSFSNSGVKNALGNFTVNNAFTINTGASYTAASFTISLLGNFRNSGSFMGGTGTVSMIGALDASVSGTTAFNNFTITKTSNANYVTLNNNITAVNTVINVGELRTLSNSITISGSRTGVGIILGTIIHTHAFATGTDYYFEGLNNFINFSSISGSVSSVSITVTSASVDGFPLDGSINRIYNVVVTNIGSYLATFRLHYLDNELNGNTEASMTLWKNTGTWSNIGKSNNNDITNFVEQSSISSLDQRWTISNVNTISIWKGGTDGAWENAANWKAGVLPIPTSIIQIGFEIFTNNPIISSSVSAKALSFGNVQQSTLTLSTGGTFTINGNVRGTWSGPAVHTIAIGNQTLNIVGDLALSLGTAGQSINITLNTGTINLTGSLIQMGDASVIFSGSGNLIIGNNYSYSSGAFTSGTGTVTYTGTSSQTIAGSVIYNNLSINKSSGLASVSSPVTINGDLTLLSSTILTVNATLTINDDLTINSGTILESNLETIYVGGNWTRSGTFNASLGTVILTGSFNKFMNASTFNHLIINKTSASISLTANVIINGNLTVSSGTLDLGIFSANRSVAGGILTVGAGTFLKLSGATNYPANYNIDVLAATSTVEYYGSVAQNIEVVTYGNLILSNGGALPKTVGGALTIAGDLTINSNATLNGSSVALSLLGNWTMLGTFEGSTGSVLLKGVTKFVTGSTTFNNLIITGSYTSASNTNVIVNGNVDLSGSYITGLNNVTLAGDVTISGSFSNDGTITYTGTRVQMISLTGSISSPLLSSVNTFAGTISPVLNSNSSPTFVNVNINNTGGLSASVGWIVSGTCNIAANCTFNGGSLTHTFYGPVNNNGTILSMGTINFLPIPTFNPSATVAVNLGNGSAFASTGLVNFGGSRQILLSGSPGSFTNVTISNTNILGVAASGNWNITGNLVVSNGSIFKAGSFTHTLQGILSVIGTLNGETSTFIVGNSTLPTEISGSGTISFNNLTISDQTIAGVNYFVSGNFICNGVYDPNGIVVTFNGGTASNVSGTVNPILFAGLTLAKSSNSVTLSQNLNIGQDIDINSGSSLIAGATTINMEGDINNNGTFNETIPTSTINFMGTVQQEISGTSITQFGHVTCNNSLGIILLSSHIVAGNLTLTTGQIVSNGFLTIDLTTGSIAGAGSGTTSGNIISKRNMDTSEWHYITSPLENTTYNDINDNVTLNADFFATYNETVTGIPYLGWTNIYPTPLTTPLQSMVGYALKFPATGPIDFVNTYTHSATASFTKTLSYTNTGNAANDGWHLVGNPFPSYIDWRSSGCVKSNMATGISYYNNAVQANADYVFGALPPASTNGASPFIPPMQAFWVQTTATGSLTIDNTARVVNPDLAPYNAPTFYRLGGNKASTIKLAVSNGTVRDEAIVRFAEIANDSMESEFDMRKVRNDGNTPSLFSKISGTDYSINSMGENFENKIIPLGLEVKTSGIYKINTIELYDFDDEISVVLEDRVLGKMTDLKADSSYNFYINNTDTTSRFFIHFQNPVITKIGENNINGITISQNLKDIVIDFGNFKNKNAIITISNSKGQILLNEVKSANLVEVKYAMESFGTNIYFVNVKVEDKNYTKKIEISSGN